MAGRATFSWESANIGANSTSPDEASNFAISSPLDQSEDGDKQLFACPFMKMDPARYSGMRNCSTFKAREIHRLFSDHLPAHVKAGDITQEKLLELKSTKVGDLTEKQQVRAENRWYELFRALFPDKAAVTIPSPYHESTMSKQVEIVTASSRTPVLLCRCISDNCQAVHEHPKNAIFPIVEFKRSVQARQNLEIRDTKQIYCPSTKCPLSASSSCTREEWCQLFLIPDTPILSAKAVVFQEQENNAIKLVAEADLFCGFLFEFDLTVHLVLCHRPTVSEMLNITQQRPTAVELVIPTVRQEALVNYCYHLYHDTAATEREKQKLECFLSNIIKYTPPPCSCEDNGAQSTAGDSDTACHKCGKPPDSLLHALNVPSSVNTVGGSNSGVSMSSLDQRLREWLARSNRAEIAEWMRKAIWPCMALSSFLPHPTSNGRQSEKKMAQASKCSTINSNHLDYFPGPWIYFQDIDYLESISLETTPLEAMSSECFSWRDNHSTISDEFSISSRTESDGGLSSQTLNQLPISRRIVTDCVTTGLDQINRKYEITDGRIKCVQCSRIFKNKSDFWRHAQNVHRRLGGGPCPNGCGKMFSRRDNAQRHALNCSLRQ